MKKNFLKSVSAAALGLSLVASCSMIKGKEAHSCSANNKCSSQKADEANKCAAKKGKKESHKCAAKKSEVKKEAPKKAE